MKIFDTLYAKLKAVVHGVAEDVRDVADKIADRVEDVKERIAERHDIPLEEVKARLKAKADNDPQKLNYGTSIVDLLKLLDMDSSKAARAALSAEFNPEKRYTGSDADNIWLHAQVMTEIGKRDSGLAAGMSAK